MKNLRWLILAIAIIGIIAYFTWAREVKPNKPAEVKSTQAKQERPSSDESETVIALSDASTQSYSSQRHAPTPVELAVDLRKVSPSTAEILLSQNANYPKAFNNNEAASLILATVLLNRNQLEDYQTLAKKWEGRSAWPAAWLALNSDFLVAQGNKEEAIVLLKSTTFDGPADLARVSRLALLTVNTDPEQALADMREAEAKDPENPFFPIMTARVLEKANKITEASQELSKAMKSNDPKQIQQVEALADLFTRYGYQPFAISIWDSVDEQLPPETAAQALFWKHVQTSASPAGKKRTPTGNPYLEYLAALPNDQFWDADSFETIPNSQTLLNTHQETYWLRLLDYLAKNDHQSALTLIRSNPFKASSWNPQLEIALEAVLNKQLNGKLAASKPAAPTPLDVEYGTFSWLKPEDNEFIAAIVSAANGQSALSAQDEALVESKNAFAGILMAEGWEKAALNMHKADDGSDNIPQWYAVEVTKALASEKGTDAALKFALEQNGSEELSLQIAELYILSGKTDEALKVLEPLRTENTEAGARAAWLSAQHYWRKGNVDVARQIILSNSRLAETPMGQEALAILSAKKNKEPTKR